MSKMRLIVLATRNSGKVREIKQELSGLPVRVAGLEQFGAIPEPPEDRPSFAANARDKALYYAGRTGQWCLADDSGLEVDALGGRPGVRSARYAADECPPHAGRQEIDRANNAKLLEALQDIPDEQRTARFICHLALADERRILIETFDTIEGRIAREPAGWNGFGYDPLFWVPALGCTTAQLSPRQKNDISHRGKAVRHFAKLLKTFLG